jgi:N-acyl-D-amino-acid deacylase
VIDTAVNVSHCQTLIRGAQVLDGTGAPGQIADVAITGGRIEAVGPLPSWTADDTVDGQGRALCPGFIDVHSHDDNLVLRSPEVLPKLSQGVTTVIVGNCGMSAAPVSLRGEPPEPLNLLGPRESFRFPDFASYAAAVRTARPSVNVAALVGHTALRSNHLDRLDRPASAAEIQAMQTQLREALAAGALGLSTGLAYASARSAPTEEVMALAGVLAEAGALYATHLRTEFDGILDALEEAFRIGRQSRVPVIVSHLKCAGIQNWGRSGDVLAALERARAGQAVGQDCYPYSASSTTLDLGQVDERIDIRVTWSKAVPEMGGKLLAEIASLWGVNQREAARRLQPAGAVYFGMSPDDVRRILSDPATSVGSDGLPDDPRPHPRLWGCFPRVLGHYSRDEKLFSLPEAVRKMTGLSAQRFGLIDRGQVRPGAWADLVLFDPATVRDAATFLDPIRPAEGIAGVWVNGVLSYDGHTACGPRAGRFLARGV